MNLLTRMWSSIRTNLALISAILIAVALPSVAAAQADPMAAFSFPPFALLGAGVAGIAFHFIAKFAEESAQSGKPVNPVVYFAGRPWRSLLMVGGVGGTIWLGWETGQVATLGAAFLTGYVGDSLFNKYKGGRPEAT